MIIGFEFRLTKDEAGKRWFRIAPVLREETPSDVSFFALIFATIGLTALAVWAMIATDVPPTKNHVNLNTGKAHYGYAE